MMALSVTGGVELVEQNRLEAVRQDQKLGVTGLIDDATAASTSLPLVSRPISPAGPLKQGQPPFRRKPRASEKNSLLAPESRVLFNIRHRCR
jgi:hypothetical protein